MASELSNKLREWKLLGWESAKTGGGHLKLTHPSAPTPIFTSSTPSDHRAIANIDAMLKRNVPGPTQAKVAIDHQRVKKQVKPKAEPVYHFKFDRPPVESRLPTRGRWAVDSDFTYEDTRNYHREALAWAFCILRLRAGGHEWDTVRIFKKRFVHDEVFRKASLIALLDTSPEKIALLRKKRSELFGSKIEQKPAKVAPVIETAPPIIIPQIQTPVEPILIAPIAPILERQLAPDDGQPSMDDAYYHFALRVTNAVTKPKKKYE